ncbi:MAG: AGE family epimerase/isomerase [Phycisphaerae bacterium]|nr:AGE family epimerase/isomerase [Phycisphaerae bacterium]
MNSQTIDERIKLYRDELLLNTIPFWMNHAIDRECGGFFTYLDRTGEVYGDMKPVWIQGRFTWLLSTLYTEVEKKPEWLETAKHGIEFLEKHCFDADGQMFFEVTREGAPLRKRRYVYSETFGSIAFARYAQAAGDEQRLDRAKTVFKSLVHHYRNPHLLPPKYAPAFQAKSHSMAMILIVTAQQMRLVWDDPILDETIDYCVDQVVNHFLKPECKALLETVGPNGEFIDSPIGRSVVPGHAIETAWFMLEESRRRKDDSLRDQALRIIDWSLEWGWDEEFGGLLYYVDVLGKPCIQYEHDMKLWWPHNEAIYATLLAHHMTGKPQYERWYERLHEYSYQHFPDPEYGEWFKYLHRDGTVSTTLKGNGWAGPFHIPRMQLKCWRLLEEMKQS